MLNSELLEFMASCWQKLCANGAWNANGRNKYANTIRSYIRALHPQMAGFKLPPIHPLWHLKRPCGSTILYMPNKYTKKQSTQLGQVFSPA